MSDKLTKSWKNALIEVTDQAIALKDERIAELEEAVLLLGVPGGPDGMHAKVLLRNLELVRGIEAIADFYQEFAPHLNLPPMLAKLVADCEATPPG